tara:strand:+ start:6530 stop:6790 length:261 start_codon:yes stop_codon:yes gene_type:complete
MKKNHRELYYKYNSINFENQYVTNTNNINIWFENEYDISLYYSLSKKLNLKTGIKDNDAVIGIYSYGWEISNNTSNPDIILKFELF